jgi:hypothetical protein
MTILSSDNINELSAAWNRRRDDAFYDKIEDDFVELMLRYVPENLQSQMLWAIHNANSPKDLQVSFGVQFEIDRTFTAEGWGDRKCSISRLLRRSNALKRIAEAIGTNIRVSYRAGVDTFFFTIDFWPTRIYPHIIMNPEEVDDEDDMPPLDS